MSSTIWRNLASLAGVLVLAMGAYAQETPPTEPDEEEIEIPVRWNSISVGYTTWRAGGSRVRMGQFGRVPEGVTLAELKYINPIDESHPYWHLTWRGTPGQDTYGQGMIGLNNGQTILKGSVLKRSYFSDPSWVPTGDSEDRLGTISVSHAIAPNVGAFISHRSDDRSQRYVPPKEAGRMRSRTVGGGVEGRFGPVQAGINITDRRTFDDTGRQPATLQRGISAHIAGQLGDALSLQGSAGYTRIEQAGRPSGGVRTAAIAGSLDLGPLTTLQFHAGRDDLDLGNISPTALHDERTASPSARHVGITVRI